MVEKVVSAFTPRLIGYAILESFRKLNPFQLWRNPVMFITEIGAIVTNIESFLHFNELHVFTLHVAIWLWFTVLFANFAESIAESRNIAQAKALKVARVETVANKLDRDGNITKINAKNLHKGDIVVVRTGEHIPADG